MGEREALPYVRCPGSALDTYSAAGHSTTDDCPRCGAPLAGGVRWDRVDGVVLRRRRAAAHDEAEHNADTPDAPLA